MRRRIYISGPMTGRPLWNFQAFADAATALYQDGWLPVSPAQVDEDLGVAQVTRVYDETTDRLRIVDVQLEGFDYREALRRDLEFVEDCEAIYLLSGWDESLGARIELDRAHALGLQILWEDGAEVPAFLLDKCGQDVDVAYATDRDEQDLSDPDGTVWAYLDSLEDAGPRPFDPAPLVGYGAAEFLGDEDPVIDPASVAGARAREDDTNPKDLIGVTKPQLHLVPPAASLRMAKVLELGATKYGPYNWREKAVRTTVYLSAAMRHLAQALDGEDFDPESGQPHEAHVAACMAILLDAADHGNLKDDRPTPGPAVRVIEELTVS